MKCLLKDCPEQLQKQVTQVIGQQPAGYGCDIISIDYQEWCPCQDERVTAKIYEVIMLKDNLFQVFRQIKDGGMLDQHVFKDSLTAGTIRNIIRSAPEWFSH